MLSLISMKFLVLSLLLIVVHATSSTAKEGVENHFLSRQSVCRRPRASCPGRGCIACREIGTSLVRSLIALRASLLRGNPSFITLVKRFETLTRDGGRADISSRSFGSSCCLRIFGTQVSKDVPSFIAYGYLGRVVYPGSFLLAFAGFQSINEGATIRDFIDELGREFRGEFFSMCRVSGTFEFPCLRGPLTQLRSALVSFALINNILDENAAEIGLAVGLTPGAFTETPVLVARAMRMEVRSLRTFELNRCCPPL